MLTVSPEIQAPLPLDPVTEAEILLSIDDTPATAGAEIPSGADALFAAVCGSFHAPDFITLREVRDATGHDAERAADALALGLYRSRGRELWGFEFKVSRSNWLCELRQPQKAESWFRFCDHWSLVVADPTIVKKEELPPGWGLAIPHKDRLKWIVKPATLEPAPLSRHALAALVYRTQQQERRDEKAAFQRGYEQAKGESDYTTKEKDKQIAQLVKFIHDFENASGLSIRQQFDIEHGSKVGRAVKALLARHPRRTDIQKDLERCAETMEREAGELRQRARNLATVISLADTGELAYWTPSIDLIGQPTEESHDNNEDD